MDKTCLSYWFPKLVAASLPVPFTLLLRASEDVQRGILQILYQEAPDTDPKPFFDDVLVAANIVGFPLFLRTGLTSGKHDWKRTCRVDGPDDIPQHVMAIAEFSECADFRGLAYDVWAVREFLPTKPIAVCPDFGDMPVCKEFRFFVNDETVECWHPYWPLEALEQGGLEAPESGAAFIELSKLSEEDEITSLASAAGKAVGGRWSVDLLETERGWFIIDMAEAEKSFHWAGCDSEPSESAAS